MSFEHYKTADYIASLFYRFIFPGGQSYAYKIIFCAWGLFLQLGIYLILGIFLASAISLFFPVSRLSSFLKGKTLPSIIIFSVLGVISPLSLYTVIPLVSSLLSAGFPAPALISFLISSPFMNPTLFIVLSGALGIGMAITITLSAVIMGISGGYLAHILISLKKIDFSPEQTGLPAGLRDSKIESMEAPILLREFLKRSINSARFIGKYFLLGLLIAAFVEVSIPTDTIASWLGPKNRYSILLAAFSGVPLYNCSGASIPLMKVLMGMGMDKGAVLSFFLSGAATRIPILAVMNSVLKYKFLIFYLMITIMGAIIFGYIYSAL